MTARTTIHDLPNEILSQILSFPCLEEDLIKVKNVCHRWNDVVDQTVGLEVSIKSSMQHGPINSACSKCSDLSVISHIGVRTCFLNLSNLEEDTGSDKRKQPSPKFKYPHLVKRISITGSLESDIFKNLIDGTFNLTMLEVNMFALHQLTLADVKNLRLDCLSNLVIQKCMRSVARGFNANLGLPIFHHLLKENMFPSLTRLDVRFPIKTFLDFSSINVLLCFLKRHLQLKVLLIMMDFPCMVLEEKNFESKVHPCIRLAESFTLETLFLSTLEIQGVRLHASYPQLEIWKKFTLTQSKLKCLTMRLGSLDCDILKGICLNNKETLEYIHLYKLNETMDESGIKMTLNCEVFSVLKKLHTLYALGSDYVEKGKALPQTLTTLFLTGCLTMEDAEYILLNLPKLKFLSLRDACSHTDGCGVSLEALRKFIIQRRVGRLILNGSSLCEVYPPEGLSNQDPYLPYMLKEFDNWHPDYTYLDWELNSESYYTSKVY